MRPNFETGNHKHSKTIQKWVDANPDKAVEYFADEDGHWVYLKDGWQIPNYFCGTVREHTVKEVMHKLRNLVKGEYC